MDYHKTKFLYTKTPQQLTMFTIITCVITKANFYTSVIKGELHTNSWNSTFVNKLQFPLILGSFVFKASKTDNRSWDIYVFSDTETRFYTISEESETINIVSPDWRHCGQKLS